MRVCVFKLLFFSISIKTFPSLFSPCVHLFTLWLLARVPSRHLSSSPAGLVSCSARRRRRRRREQRQRRERQRRRRVRGPSPGDHLRRPAGAGDRGEQRGGRSAGSVPAARVRKERLLQAHGGEAPLVEPQQAGSSGKGLLEGPLQNRGTSTE